MVNSQARLIWTSSVAFEFFPDNEDLLSSAVHEVDLLATKMWDEEYGGSYDEGYYNPGEDNLTIRRNIKTWWAQPERLNALLPISQLYPNEPMIYEKYFFEKWSISTHISSSTNMAAGTSRGLT